MFWCWNILKIRYDSYYFRSRSNPKKRAKRRLSSTSSSNTDLTIERRKDSKRFARIDGKCKNGGIAQPRPKPRHNTILRVIICYFLIFNKNLGEALFATFDDGSSSDFSGGDTNGNNYESYDNPNHQKQRLKERKKQEDDFQNGVRSRRWLSGSECVVDGGSCTECVDYCDGDAVDTDGDCINHVRYCNAFTCNANTVNVDLDSSNGCEQSCAEAFAFDVINGTCTECSSGGQCSAVTCNAQSFDSDGDSSNGCELTCPVDGGNCTSCSSEYSVIDSGNLVGTCYAVTCNTGKVNADGDAANGCECPVVTDGTCTDCTTADASGCAAVTCIANKFDTNEDAADGCEASCAAVTGGTCTACATADASGCTAVTCNANKFDPNNNAAEGCERS
jgi:hypothetical protein